MKKKVVIATALLILLTTITFPKKNLITHFNLKEIKVENNLFIQEKEIKILLSQIYNKNIFFLKNKEIEIALLQNTFIDSFKIKKIYPNKIKIIIFEKKPIAILINKKKKNYISEKIELIEFKEIPIFKDLPYVFGNIEEFKLFYINLKKTNFPLNEIKKYILFESNRWDLEIKNKKIIKLPSKNYNESIINFLDLKKYENFSTYKVFDYRIKNQVIIK
mgnify:CR=1 FL=1